MRNIAILMFDDVEILDATGPFEVFSVAARLVARQAKDKEPPFEVFTVGQHRQHRSRHGLTFVTHHDFQSHPPIDVLIVPGGVVEAETENPLTLDWIVRAAPRCEVIASVCTGAFLLAHAGLLEGKQATTHWEDIEDLRSTFPNIKVRSKVRWTQDGNIWTSAGIAAGIDMSLHLVAALVGNELAQRTATQMEYRWDNDERCGSG